MSLLPALTGSFSTPAADNPTGAMMEAAYAHHGIDARYVNCDVAAEDLADAVRGATAMGWIGFNCSLPHKVAVIQLLDELAESARLIGAVNCAVRRNGRWIGENTDGQGFLASLRTVAEPAGQRVLILGAGGAARAIAVELALAGASELWVANRNFAKAAEIAALVDAEMSGSLHGGRVAGEVDRAGVRHHCGERNIAGASRFSRSATLIRPDPSEAGGVRRDPESARHRVPAAGAPSRCDDPRRPGNAAQPSGDQYPALDRYRPGS